ncbi:zinc finger protein 708-like [Armigeres subalbatus]|uniref:zinc finger protein 708-like n=1 Tax=Armigeres subalbatus TaxID=124917 RepID=UPI002ED479D5
MPCCIEQCTPGKYPLVKFPSSRTICKRWRDAILAGTGTVPSALCKLPASGMNVELGKRSPTDKRGPLLEICLGHFPNPKDRYYQDPTVYDNSMGKPIKLECCRLCHRFEPGSKMFTLDGKMGGQYLNHIVSQTMKIRFRQEDPRFLSICQECLIKVDLVRTIQDQYRMLEAHHEIFLGSQAPLELVDGALFEDDGTLDNDELGFSNQTEVLEMSFLIESVENDGEIPQADPTESENEVQSNEKELEIEDKPAPKRRRVAKPKKRGRKPKEFKQKPPLKAIRLRTELTRKCYICPADFPDSEVLIAHLTEQHAGKIEYVCQQCDGGKPLKTVKSFNVHLSLHDASVRPLQCNFCTLRYSTRKGLEVHEMRDHGAAHKHKIKPKLKRQHQCEHCGKIFKSISIVREHKLVVHDQGVAAQCKICQKTFKHKSNLARHMLMHSGEMPHKCDECGIRFKIVTDLTKHVQGVHQGKMPYFCYKCDIPLKDKNAYYRHRTVVHKAMRDVPAQRRYRCGLCVTTCDIQSDLQLHVDECHPDQPYPFKQCSLCPDRFLTSSQLQYHKYTKHCEQRSARATKLQCDICGEQQQTRCHLDSHMTKVHGAEKRYVCSDCGSRFTVRANLSRHRKTHNAVKQFACEFCARTFNQKVAMDNHRRCAHTGEMAFECETCGKGFKETSTYYRHRVACRRGQEVSGTGE